MLTFQGTKDLGYVISKMNGTELNQPKPYIFWIYKNLALNWSKNLYLYQQYGDPRSG